MLEITLLGEQAVLDAATGEVRTRASRTIALLAYLVVHLGSPQPRTRIACAFWPDSSDAQALTNLRRELHQLRQVLPGLTGLQVSSTHLVWTPGPDCAVDLADFLRERTAAAAAARAGRDEEALSHGLRALERYGGELLPGSEAEWVLPLRARLAEAACETADLACDAALRCGRPAAAVPAARCRLSVAPLEERGYRTLMELQLLAGDRAGAITTYHRCASVLEQELGVDPGPETARLLDRVLGRGDRPGDGTGTAPRRPRRPGFVGRRSELHALEQAWLETVRGRGRLVLLHGAAGVGKTRLVTELAARASAGGAAVGVAECFETSGRLSLAPVAQWLRGSAFAAARAGLDPVWRGEVERLLPARADDPRTTVAGTVDVWQRHRFFEGLARCLLAAGRPTLLVLENLQWCDEDTLTFCSMLRTFAARAPLLLVVTMRADSAGEPPAGPAGRWTEQMATTGRWTSVPVEPLDVQETAALADVLTGVSPGPSSAALLHAATGGFPLYVVEASRSTADLSAALDHPDPSFTAILRKRLERLSPAARAVAGLAASVGQDFGMALLTEASDLSPDAVVIAVDELWRQRIVREQNGSYDFTHDRLREAAYALVSPPRRWLLHRRIAQALELLHAGRTDEVAALVAAQYSAAGNRERAVVFYRQAAQVAGAVFAHSEAVAHHRATLALLGQAPATRDREEQELACLQAMIPPLNALQGYASEELEHACERATGLAASLGHREARLTVMVGLWACRFVRGQMPSAHALAEEILDLVEPRDSRLGQAHFSLAGSLLHLGEPAAARDHFEQALDAVTEDPLLVGTRARVHTAAWAAHAAWTCGDAGAARRLMRQAVDEARRTGHQYSLAVALAYAAITCQLLEDRDGVAATARELRELCARCGFAYYGEWGRILQGWHVGGEAGEALAREGVANLLRQRAHARLPYWLGLLAETVTEPDASRAVLDEALAAADAQQELWWVPELLRRRARHDEDPRPRLEQAVALARRQASAVLRDRCEDDVRSLAGAVGER
ncbi:MAG: ATP-binding protein [Nocardioidaceae bacterium]